MPLQDIFMNVINETRELDKAMEVINAITAQIPYVSRYEGERSYRLAKLEAVFDRDDIDRLAKLVKSEHNTYGLGTELERLDIIWRLVLKGFSFPQIYDWVEKQQEREVMFLLECGFEIGKFGWSNNGK